MQDYDQKQKVLARMIMMKGKQEWFYAPDFQKPDMPQELYVGYEATARMSDVCKEYPYMVEKKKEGKYRYIRFRFEAIDDIFNMSTPVMADWLDGVFFRHGVPKERTRKSIV